MAVAVMVPRLGWSMDSGVFGEWLKQDGEPVTAGDPLFSIEGEKAMEEVESEDEGILRIRPGVAAAGVELTVGTVIGWLLADGEAVPEAPEPPDAGTAAVTPDPAPGAATPQGPAGPHPAGRQPAGPQPPRHQPTAQPATAAASRRPAGRPRSDGRPASSPRARRVARELGVDWRSISGSGAGGRIRERDVRAVAARRGADEAPPAAAAPLPDLSAWGPVEILPLPAARRRAAERLDAAARTVPMAAQLGAADVTRLEALRERYAARVRDAGGALTMTAVLAKVAASALKAFPHCNAGIDVAGGRLVRRGYRHVAFAVETGHGAVFPVVRHADRKNLLQLSAEAADLSARARAGALQSAETEGGCLSVYAPGGADGPAASGIGHFSPPVRPPEAAMLGAAPPAREPVFDGAAGVRADRLRMPLSLTCDHRVIGGADGMRFLRWIIDALEEPLLLALEG